MGWLIWWQWYKALCWQLKFRGFILFLVNASSLVCWKASNPSYSLGKYSHCHLWRKSLCGMLPQCILPRGLPPPVWRKLLCGMLSRFLAKSFINNWSWMLSSFYAIWNTYYTISNHTSNSKWNVLDIAIKQNKKNPFFKAFGETLLNIYFLVSSLPLNTFQANTQNLLHLLVIK